ncbi:MAG: BatD family protein [bacterium]
MVKKINNLLLILFFTLKSVIATNINLELQGVEIENGKNIVYLGESFQLIASVIVDGKWSDELQIYGLDNFKASVVGGHSSDIEINGYVEKNINVVYSIQAEKNGEFKIGPAFIVQDDKRIDSNILDVTVKTRSAGQPVSRSNRKGSANINTNFHDYEVFCKLDIKDPQIFIGQPTLLTASIYTNGAILQMGVEPFKSSDFIVKDIEQVLTRQENVGGKIFNVSEKRYLITPLKEGLKEVKPLVVEFVVPVYKRKRLGMFGDDFLPTGFFGQEVEQKKVLSNPLKLDVQALPKYSGSVDGIGALDSFELTVDKKEVLINEPITVKLKLEGIGNLEQITYPKLNVPSSCKYYESRFDVRQDLKSDLTKGSKIFEYVLQVGQAGELKIPEQNFTYFDTKSHSYNTLKTQSLELKINPGDEDELFVQNDLIKSDSSILNGKKNETFKSDINFISEELAHESNKFSLPYWLFLVLILLPIIIFYRGSIFKFCNKIEKKYFSGFARRKNLNAFEKKLDNIIKQQKIEQLYQFYINYMAFKYDLSHVTITENFISQKLLETGWPENMINDFLDYLNKCASYHFAGKDSGFKQEQNFLSKAKYWFEQLKK